MPHESSGEYVMVPVPIELVGAVYQFLSARMANNGSPPLRPGDSKEPVSVPGEVVKHGNRAGAVIPWTERDIRRLKHSIDTPTPRVMFDIVSQPDNSGPVAFPDLIARAGRSRREAMSDLAGFTQLVRHEFGRDNLPYTKGWNGKAIVYMVASPEIAQWWRTA